ncbi:MAG: hypothetical protein GW903_09650 [Alphaproteobacteria bacterium]|nr:hypothetical protein [Alphaproteobacteria bacterium]NCQ89270.1 hypothetical protein [Alphaproteobacteria bacterium]NCT08133.1 hypothetical protein [Alphaproteobacteria bacterium]
MSCTLSDYISAMMNDSNVAMTIKGLGVSPDFTKWSVQLICDDQQGQGELINASRDAGHFFNSE